MPRRIAGYAGRCIESFGLPIYSHVIYLHPDAGRNDPGQYIQEIQDYTIVVKYKVIRLFQVPKPEGMGLFNPLPDLMFFGLGS